MLHLCVWVIIFITLMYVWCIVYVCTCIMCGSGIICGSQFSASAVWIWGSELRWSGPAAAALSCCAILRVLNGAWVMVWLDVNSRAAAVSSCTWRFDFTVSGTVVTGEKFNYLLLICLWLPCFLSLSLWFFWIPASLQGGCNVCSWLILCMVWCIQYITFLFCTED